MEKKKKKKKIGFYLAGSLLLAVGAMVVAPIMIEFLTDRFHHHVKRKVAEEDWGPEIVRKEKPEKEKSDGKL